MSRGELYQALILEHGRRPRHRRVLDAPSHRAHSDNPLCGDHIDLYLEVERGVIRDIAFDGVACAIATASASLMTEALQGGDIAHARRVLARFRAMIDPAQEANVSADAELGGLGTLAAVRAFPARIGCALLPWQALDAALDPPAH